MIDHLGPPQDPGFDPERRRHRKSRHSWSHPLAIDKAVFTKLSSFCQMMYSNSGIKLADGLGNSEQGPIFSEDIICFNGSSPADGDSFYFPRISDDLFGVIPPGSIQMYERLCDTHRFPYDTMVVACLEAACHFNIISEWTCGGYKEDHQDGLDLFLGYKDFDKQEVN